MRLRNLWFDLPSFLVAVVFFLGTAFHLGDLLWKKHANVTNIVFAAAIGLGIACVFCWVSLTLGSIKKRRFELNQQQRRQDTR